MGGIVSCLKPNGQTNDDAISKEPKKAEMTNEDKAVLDLKKTNRMLNKQVQDLEERSDKFWEQAKIEKKNKNGKYRFITAFVNVYIHYRLQSTQLNEKKKIVHEIP